MATRDHTADRDEITPDPRTLTRGHLERVYTASETLRAALQAAFHAKSTDYMAPYMGVKGHRLDDVDNSVFEFLGELNWVLAASRAAAAGLTRSRGRPPDLVRFMVISDIALIFRWASKTKPSRRVNRDTHLEEGPFWDFARAIWVEVVGKGYPESGESAEVGLQMAVKNLLAATPDQKRSPILCNVHLNHPEWRIFAP